MEKIGDMELYTTEEVFDKAIGPKGTPRRDKIEEEAEEFLLNYNMGLAIRKVRESKGLTQEQLGEKMKVSRSRVSRLERGKNLTLAAIVRMLKAMEIPISLELEGVGKVPLW